jgi:PAS domain S-box-containing protein
MEGKSPQNSALLQSLTVFFVSLGVIILVAIFIPLSTTNAGGLAFVSAVVTAVFIAKNVYDNAVLGAETATIQKNFAENVISVSRELYTEIYQKSPVPYILIDLEGNIKSANLAALRFFAIPKGTEVGVNVFQNLHTEEPQHLEFMVRKFQNRIPVSDETVQVKTEKGGDAWALLSLFHFVSSNQHMGLLTLVDITKQKRIETAKSEFVSLASHQLRTPIAGIKWSAELLQMDAKDTLTERQQKYIDRLLLGAKRMAVLVDDFLRVSRFELGTFRPEYVEVNFKDIIEEILNEQTERITQKKVEIRTFYDEHTETFVSDPNLLRMIATNLITNAVKYSKESGSVHIGYTATPEDIVFSVADNGIGIPAEDQERVFGKLFRAANAVRNVPDGTGLGLYIVKEAIDVLHGKASFTSTEGKGTTFEVTIPLSRTTP